MLLVHWDLLCLLHRFTLIGLYLFFILFVLLQGSRALSSFAGRFIDPELSRLTSCLPLCCLGAKVDSTTERYSRAFEKVRVWAASYKEISVLPSDYFSVATYLEFLLQRNSSYSALEAAVYGIRWAHELYGLSNPCDCSLVKGVLESAKRSLSRPIVKKEPVNPDMIFSVCQKYASDNATLSDLRTAAICVTAYAGFLQFNELAYLRCCDVKFCEDKYVQLFIAKSKTDIYRGGNFVVLAKTGHITCPYSLLNRYIQAAGIDLSSDLRFFRSLHFVKSKASYTLRRTGMSYTRTREVDLDAFSQLEFCANLFGLHSLRSGGATAAANAGVNDRLFKRHGRWRSDKAMVGYVKNNLDALLSVSESLGI